MLEEEVQQLRGCFKEYDDELNSKNAQIEEAKKEVNQLRGTRSTSTLHSTTLTDISLHA